jgi:hypothetical protein
VVHRVIGDEQNFRSDEDKQRSETKEIQRTVLNLERSEPCTSRVDDAMICFLDLRPWRYLCRLHQ